MPSGNTALLANTWTRITTSDVAGAMTFENLGGSLVTLWATTDNTPPAAVFKDGFQFPARDGFVAKTMAELFPGTPGAVQLWALSDHVGGEVMLSYV